MQQGVRFDPDMPQTIRLEFAKSNTKVSKPKQPAAAAATSHPALMHPLTGRKYAPPLVHLLDTSHLLFLTHCTDYKVSHFLLSLGCFFSKGFFFTYVPSLAPSPAPATGSEISSSRIVRQPIEVRRGFSRQTFAINIILQRKVCTYIEYR